MPRPLSSSGPGSVERLLRRASQQVTGLPVLAVTPKRDMFARYVLPHIEHGPLKFD